MRREEGDQRWTLIGDSIWRRILTRMPTSNDETRQWHWVFRALWSAAPKLAETRQRRNKSRRMLCHLHLLVPDTVLFQHGEPCKWVGSSPEGIVVRKPFQISRNEPTWSKSASSDGEAPSVFLPHPLPPRMVNKHHAPSSVRVIDDFELLERMDNIIAAFMSFADTTSPPGPDVAGDLPVCVARYNDGTMELLSGRSLKTLCSLYNWRASLCALQAYVRPAKQSTMVTALIGTYNRKRARGKQNRLRRRLQVSESVQDGDGSASESTTAFDYGSTYTSDNVPLREEPSKYASSTTNFGSSECRPAGGLAEGEGDETSPSPVSLQAATAFVDQATQDVAFVADFSYAWPVISPYTTPRRSHSHAIADVDRSHESRDSRLLQSPDNVMEDDSHQAGSRPVLTLGGQIGKPHRPRPPCPKSRVQVSHLETEFVVDQAGRPWLISAPKVIIQLIEKPLATVAEEERQRSKRKRLKEEALLASSVAARELRAVVSLARRRGLNGEEMFRHFAVGPAVVTRAGREGSSRFAGTKEVMDGMMRLGIALPEEASTLLIETIVGSTAESTRQHSTPPAVSACRLQGALDRSPPVPREQGDTLTGEEEKKEPSGALHPPPKPKPPALVPKPPLTLRRPYITAEDLWNFASGAPAQDATAQGSGEDAKPVVNLKEECSTYGDYERFPSLSPGHTLDGSFWPSALKRRRTKKRGGHQRGGSGKEIAREDTPRKNVVHGADKTHRMSPLPAQAAFDGSSSSISSRLRYSPRLSRGNNEQVSRSPQASLKTRSFFSTGRGTIAVVAGAGAGAGTGASSRRVGLEVTAGKDHPRLPMSMTPAEPRDVPKGSGDFFGLLRTKTLPASCGSKTATAQGHVPAPVMVDSASGKKSEVASFPCEDPVAEARDGKDRVFHVDRALVIAYRVLRQQIEPENWPLHQRTDSVADTDIGGTPCTATESGELKHDSSSSVPSLMVMVPGLFQTLDTLEEAVSPLIEAHPTLTVLLVAPPGLPNTHWPVARALDGELTALCVSTLLEHLLEGDELLSNHKAEDDSGVPPNGDSMSESHREYFADRPPLTATPRRTLPRDTGEAQQAVEATHPVVLLGSHDGPGRSFLPTSGIPSSETAARPPSPRIPPLLFVGFGTGANSLLHLATGPLQPPLQPLKQERGRHCRGGRGGDGGGGSGGGDEDDKVKRGGDAGGGARASNGLLASVLSRRGLRIGGLILVNGFVSLDEQSKQVVRTLRQAFCDQSDGRARVEAVTSLLLSEHHLAAASPSRSTQTTAAATAPTREFMETRKALRLDSDVSAHVYPQTPGSLSPGTVALVTGGTEKNEKKTRRSVCFPQDTEKTQAAVGVESILRDLHECNQKRKRRVQRRQRRQLQRRGARKRRSARIQPQQNGIDAGIVDTDDDRHKSEAHSQQELDNGEAVESGAESADGCKSLDRNKPGSDSTRVDHRRDSNADDAGSRLALAASVSILSGLLGGCTKQEGESCSRDDGLLGQDHSSSRGAVSGVLTAIRRSRLPVLMVQSTDDALIGLPLALVLKQELHPEEALNAETGSVRECLKPPEDDRPTPPEDGRPTPAQGSSRQEAADCERAEQELEKGRRRRERRNCLAADEAGLERDGEASEGSLFMHTCWVKSGHDVVYERAPFLRALLHKAIYACQGRDTPPMPFLKGDPGPHAPEKNVAGDGGTGVAGISSGSNGILERLLPPQPFVTTAELDPSMAESNNQQLVDDGSLKTSKGEAERNLPHRHAGGEGGGGGGRGRPDLGNAVLAARGYCDVGGVANAVTKDFLGTPPRDLEVSDNVFCPDNSLISSDRVVLDGNLVRTGSGAAAEIKLPPSETVSAGGYGYSTAESSSLLPTATSIRTGRAPKLVDFFNPRDDASHREFRAACDYLEGFRDFDLDKSILKQGLGATGQLLATLDLPLVARFAFQTMKDCWRCRILLVEVVRLDLGMRKKQAYTREQLALSIRAVSNLSRTLRKSNKEGNHGVGNNDVEATLFHLEPLDQRALKIEIAAAEVTRAKHYYACRQLRRSGSVLSIRRKRLEATLASLIGGVRGTLQSLERIMGQLRKQLALARIQERVYHEQVVNADRTGLKARRRLAVVKEQLAMLELHPDKWTDSDAWQPGYMQRLETVELIKMLAAESQRLRLAVDKAGKQKERACELHVDVSQREASLVSTMEGVSSLLSLLIAAIEDERFVKAPEAAVDAQTTLENEVLGDGGDSRGEHRRRRRKLGGGGGEDGSEELQSVAACVRAKPHRSRTPDEKRWVALDAVMNPDLYHHVTLAEAEEMRWDALYYTRLDRDDLLRVLSLPPQVQLALPLLHTPDEVAAHELLARFTHGIEAGHFAQRDRESQDVCTRRQPTSMASSFYSATSSTSESAAAIGIETTAVATTPKAQQATDTKVEGDGNEGGTTRRVLACMRRAAEATLKLPSERDAEETVWCVLDRKLRPDLYHDSDEAAADRAEELHREADIREDARHVWLASPDGDIITREVSPRFGQIADGSSGGGGGGTTMGSVVDKKRQAEAAAAAIKAAENREALVTGIDALFTEDDLKAMAAAAAGAPLGGGQLGLELSATAIACGKREVGGVTKTQAGVDGGLNEAFALTLAIAERERGAKTPSGRGEGRTMDHDDDSANDASTDEEGRQLGRPEERRRLVEVVGKVLPLFLVAEEETPLGRDMTRSLAMLQEVALRLGRGQNDLFSGLNPQSALAFLRCQPSLESASPATDDRWFTAAAAATTDGDLAASGDGEADGGEREAGPGGSCAGGTGLVVATAAVPKAAAEDFAGVNNDVKASLQIEKVYGSWEEVHPAALGVESQEASFSAGKVEGAHPASFRRSAPNEGSNGSSALSSPLTTTGASLHHAHQRQRSPGNDGNMSASFNPLDILTGETGLSGTAPGWLTCEASGESKLIASGMDRVGELDPGEVRRRGLLVASRQRACLLDVPSSELQADQSKAYAFQVGPYGNRGGSFGSTSGEDGTSADEAGARPKDVDGRESSAGAAGPATETVEVVVGIAATVVYQGNFEKEGYRLGRLAAGLYRMPPKPGKRQAEGGGRAELPQPVGFAPYSLQSLNTPESMGRIMIFHQPRVQPVREGRFQLVIGAASRVRYSVSVVALTAADALTAFDESVKEAKRVQKRLPRLLEEMERLKDTSRLARWKQRIVRELLEEAREEAVRCDGEVREAKREIQEEEDDQKLDDDGRRALLAEARELSAELSRWKTLFASRLQEGKDVRAGLESIQAKLTVLEDEAVGLRKQLAKARKSLPAAAFVLKSQREATDLALALNATVDKFSGAAARWAAADLLNERAEATLSPADRVRRALKEDGWHALTLEEKQFSMLDRVLRPDFYQWMRESYASAEGLPVLAPEIPETPARRKDSLDTLIGARPIGSKGMDAVENLEEAMHAKKSQGFSNKAKTFVIPTVWSGKGKETAGAARPTGGGTTARSEATGVGALTARSGIENVVQVTLADEWRLQDFSFTAMELERITSMPFHRLQRRELKARKLLRRFNDDKQGTGENAASTEELNRAAEIHCAAVRAKHPALRTSEENEWVEIDKILFPDIWRQKRRDEERLRHFNLTQPTMPRPSGLEDSEDSEDDYDGDGGVGGSGKLGGNGQSGRVPGPHERKKRMLSACPFDREEILRIWSSDQLQEEKGPRLQNQHTLGEDCDAVREREQFDKRRTRELLLTFNGPFSTFAKDDAGRNGQGALDAGPLTVTSSKRIAYYVEEQYRTTKAHSLANGDAGELGSTRGPGPDAKLIALLRELMTAKSTHSKYMDTNVAHNTAQRFSTEYYAKELERDIAAQLRQQILERERAVAFETTVTNYEVSVSESSDDEDENWETAAQNDAAVIGEVANIDERFTVQTTRSSLHKSSPRTRDRDIRRIDSANGGIIEIGRAQAETAAAVRVSAAPYGVGGGRVIRGGSPRDDDNGTGDTRARARQGADWHDRPTVQIFTREEVQDLVYDDPGWEGCRACLTLPCRWCSCVDHRSIGARKTQIWKEVLRLMDMWDEDEVVTTIPLSCVRGGPTTVLRTDAIGELRWEAQELDRQLHLAAVDKELHDAFNCTRSAFEVKSLHEYPTLMWTKDAQGALSKERELILAKTTAQEVVDDLLESMLDGWVFGERQAEFAAGGFIPAVKASGALRPGDQRRAVAYVEHRHRLRRMAHAKGERLPEEIKGTHHTKALPIDDTAQKRIVEGRASRKKEDHKHLLHETETTLKFGLFCMIQGYLHAMMLVQREKEAWSGKGDVMTRDGNNSTYRPPMTSERKKMVQEEVKARERAATRRKFMDRARKAEDRGELREVKDKRRIAQLKAKRVLEIRAREAAARNIQRVFRGFRGKIFAQRWALKRAEIDALKAVLHEAAINIQRAFRGHLGRVEASEVRMELAEYISDIRVKEAESDIADFWETHKLRAAKEKFKKKFFNTVAKPIAAMRRRKLE